LLPRYVLTEDAGNPATGIGYGYVTNRMGVHLEGDPRDVALRAAIPTITVHQ
jgi:hypothetical protein